MISDGFILKKDTLADELRQRIRSGRYRHGEKLPVEVALAEELAVSRDTLRAALNLLEKENLVVRVRSKGTFVNQPEVKADKVLVLFKSAAESDPSYQGHYLLPAMQSAAQSCHLKLQICPRDYLDTPDTASCAASLKANRELAGAVLFEGDYRGDEYYLQALRQANIPVVLAMCHAGDVRTTGCAGVRVDTRQAFHEGILNLHADGHRRIAFFLPHWAQGYGADLESFFDFLKSRGIYAPELICDVPINEAAIARELKRLMSLSTPPTAIQASSDFFAMHILRAARELGIRIPEDIALMGYCGDPGGNMLTPPLATVDFHYENIGTKIIELLVRSGEWFRKANVAPPELIMPYEIVMRRSAMQKRVEQQFITG